MIQNITTYYIPQNINIQKGKIYNLYINKVTNLDLQAIIPTKHETLNDIIQPTITEPKMITLTEDEYQNILLLTNKTRELYDQSKELEKKLTKGRG